MSKNEVEAQDNCVNSIDYLEAARATDDVFRRLRERNSPYKTPEAVAFYKRFAERLPQKYIDKAIAALEGRADGHNVATLAAANAYSDAGLHVIDSHGLKHNGKGTGPGGQVKIPRGTGWQHQATRDHEEIAKRWRGEGDYPADSKGNAYPYAPIGAPRNLSAVFPEGFGLMVIDLDGPEGLQAWADLEAEYGPAPKTWESVTGSGGRHLIFRAPGVDIRNTASAIAPGVDVRGKNGQILVSPSLHPNGTAYEWLEGCMPGECEVAAAPEWVVKRAQDASKVGKAKDAEVEKEVRATRRYRGGAKGSDDRVSGLGFEGYLATIGDGDDLRGFDNPIYSAALSYFATGGDDEAALIETLRDAVMTAPCKDKRNVTRYAQDDYLVNRVAQARDFIAAQTPETDLDQFEDPEDWLPLSYKIKRGTIYKVEEDAPDVPVCQRFDVVGRSSNFDGTAGTGRIIEYKNENGESIELTLDRAELFRSDGGDTIKTLADTGMRLYVSGRQARERLLSLFQQISPQRRIPTIPTPGWTRDRMGGITGFMLPTGEHIAATDDADAMRLHSQAAFKDKGTAGTLAGSQIAANAALNSPNFYWTLGLCIGFIGPLQTLIGAPSGGMNFSGDSSLGKTLAEILAAMAWGNPHTGKAALHGMNNTQNAIEDLAVRSSGTVLCLDEIGQMQRLQDLSAVLFNLGSGAGKGRKSGSGLGLVDTAEFQVFALLSNEHSLKVAIEGAGGKYKTGLSVRFPDVDVTGGARVSADVLAKLDHARTNFGHMGPVFIQHLIDAGWINRGEELKARVSAVADELAGEKAAPATRRAAQVFAMARVAGELAVDAGLFDGKDRIEAAVCEAFKRFKGSDEGQATEGSSAMLDGLRSYIVRNMNRTIIPAHDASEPGYRGIIGWYTSDQIILDKQAIGDVSKLGLNGKLAGLLDALDQMGALDKSGRNRAHTNLPADVKMDGDAKQSYVPNYRIKRDILGV